MLLSTKLLNLMAFFCSNVQIPVPEYHSISLTIMFMIEHLSKQDKRALSEKVRIILHTLLILSHHNFSRSQSKTISIH